VGRVCDTAGAWTNPKLLPDDCRHSTKDLTPLTETAVLSELLVTKCLVAKCRSIKAKKFGTMSPALVREVLAAAQRLWGERVREREREEVAGAGYESKEQATRVRVS
jgi:hypothetical protein